MTPQPAARRRGRRAPAATLAGALLFGIAAAPAPAAGPEEEATPRAFEEVGRVPLLGAPEITADMGQNGWLLVNPASRRGYQVMETTGGPIGRTVLQSFDLDTLAPRRRAVLAGVPITTGIAGAAGPGTTASAGEVVHAFDGAMGRLYLALSDTSLAGQALAIGGSDSQRPLSRFVAVDEAAFDRGDARWAASFREPLEQARLHSYFVLGLTVDGHHRGAGGLGRLLVLLAQPGATGEVPVTDHTLARWEPPPGERFRADAPLATGAASDQPPDRTAPVTAPGPARRLEVCAAPMASTSGDTAGSYQWGILATPEAVWTACQVSEGAGAAVRVALGDTGHPVAVGGQDAYPLSQRLTDVLVDPGGGRMLLRSWGNGHTWWVFDTALRRFTGAIAAKSSDFYSLAAGLDPATGRLYQLTQDYVAGSIPVRGGLAYADTRLDPAPPLENAEPALAYPALFAVRSDPVTRRVFVRRGHPSFRATPVYPGTQTTTAAPAENFYRVLRDNTPITERPAPPDDSAFTTDTPESSATRASYLGTGSGQGSRAWLVGGLHAASNRNGAVAQSPCGRDDRELVAGHVREVEASDQSTTADAASLDGDARTQDDLASPVRRCVSGSSPADTDEGAFDEYDPKTAKRSGENLYRAGCVGDGDDEADAPARGTLTTPSGTQPTGKAVPRHRFRAETTCDHSHGRASARAEGALSVPAADQAQDDAGADTTVGGQVPGERAEVGYSSSSVTVVREPGGGVTVRAESIARMVVIPGVGTIGAVRGEAVATATGRRGGAGAVYRRTVCDVHIGALHQPGCRDETEQAETEAQMNLALRGRGRVRFRPPDPALLAGSASGYKAGVQRPAADGFEDARISRDTSLALPAMELVLYNGDGTSGTGRQFLHLAGVQASVSYGIACLYGQRDDGRCNGADDAFDSGGDDAFGTGTDAEPEVVTVTEPGGTVYVPAGTNGNGGTRNRSLIRRILEAPVRLVEDALRLLFSDPREFGLMAAVWALLYAPCYLGERRRSIRTLRARRAAVGGAA